MPSWTSSGQDGLTLFGFLAVALMLVCHALEERSQCNVAVTERREMSRMIRA